MFGTLYEKRVEYRSSAFSKQEVYIWVSSLRPQIQCNGFYTDDSKKDYCGIVSLDARTIEIIENRRYKGKTNALYIEGYEYDSEKKISIYLPDITEINEVKAAIQQSVEKAQREAEEEEHRRRDLEEKHRKKEQELIELQEKQKDFFLTEYLDVKQKMPVYVFEENPDYVTFMYIDDAKGICIKSIDRTNMKIVSSTICYDAIHYYEKAGNIHYVSDVNMSLDVGSLAASFVPTKVKLAPMVVGGLLFGAMGMVGGTMLGVKPSHFDDSIKDVQPLKVTNGTTKIDDRSVILNYYSEKKNQYADIELPHDIYNFLQTHLAEKKYDIVLANEKQKFTRGGIETQRLTGDAPVQIVQKKLSLEEFEEAIKKLKMLKEYEMISDEEYNAKKAELLNGI